MNLLCPDSVPSFLNLFDLSIAPPLLFYTYIPVVVVSVLIGVYVLIKSQFSLVGKLLFAISASFTLWVINIFFAWIAAYAAHVMFSWAITPIFEASIFISSIYFAHVFINNNKDVSLRVKIILCFLALPILVILPTELSIKYFNLSICEGIPAFTWYYYMYAFEIIAILWIIFICIKKYRKIDSENINKKQILYFAIGISSFLTLFVGSNLIGQITLIQTISFIGSVGMVVFMGFLAYLIVKFKAFNIKMIGAQALVVALVIIIGSQFFFIQNFTNKILTGVTFVLALGFGIFLIKSVKNEVKRKEELQIMSDKLAQANDQLRELDNAKSEFISIASHQLRTPLTAVKGFISLLLEGSYGDIESKIREVLNKVYLSNERLIDLVEDLLNLSRIESGRMEYTFEKVNMPGLIQEVYDTFVIRAKESNLKMEMKLPEGDFPEVTTDRNKIREVISNLVDNALKYTKKGWVKIKLIKAGDDKIQIAISDTGIGVPKEEMPYLFSKFSRGKDINRLNTTGTGLGLHVGKRMIEALHGQILVESPGADMGSTFIIEVPLETTKEA